MPKFLINYSNSLLIEGKGDELADVLNNLKNYDKILDRGPISAQYDYLLYNILRIKTKMKREEDYIVQEKLLKTF